MNEQIYQSSKNSLISRLSFFVGLPAPAVIFQDAKAA
jgi:hypothetical protein